jgi:hypothetical protein
MALAPVVASADLKLWTRQGIEFSLAGPIVSITAIPVLAIFAASGPKAKSD